MIFYSVFNGRRLIADIGIDDAKRSAGIVFEALYASMSSGTGREGNRAVVKRVVGLEDVEEIRIIHGPPIDRQFGVEEDELPRDELDRIAVAGREAREIGETDGKRFARFVNPLFAGEICKKCHIVEVGDVLGAISVKIPLKKYDERIDRETRRLFMTGTAILGATIVLSFLFILRIIIRPLRKFQEAAHIISGGDLNYRIEAPSGLEINMLADEFNSMASKLRELYRNLEKKVEERTRELTMEIAERKKFEETIRHMAYHDHLTGLPNRLLLTDRLNQVLARGRWHKRIAAVLYLDLDRFKDINDTLGHPMGDELLKAVAERLVKCLRGGDTVARQGGDEFTMLLQDVNRIDDVTVVIEKILSSFVLPFTISGHEIFLTTSIGISIYPDDGDIAETLLKNADIAMYQAKEEGRNKYRLFTPAMNEKLAKRLDLENRLRKAAEKEEFLLYYQPEVDINTGEVIGIESLLRWQEPERGLTLPGEFIPFAEDSGLIVPIGEWVMRTACTQNRVWQERGLKPVSIAVNLSMRQFRQKNFLDTVARILKETGLDPKYLDLELTESVLMDDVESVIDILNKLKAMGIRLTIDDFGTGYSSLEYLKRMPINMLKIAQSFIRNITSDPNDATIATTIIRMGHSLGIEVIAEGVETVEQLNLLRRMQCDKIQGYFASRPVPAGEVEEFLGKGRFFRGLKSG